MKLKNVIKCHMAYLLSKSTITIIVLIICLLLAIYMSNAIVVDYGGYRENVEVYYSSCVSLTKMIYTTLSCFMMASFFSIKNDAYLSLLIVAGIDKKSFIITKLIALVYSLLVIVLILFLLYLLNGFIFIRGFVFERRYMKAFLSFFLIGLAYGFLSVLLTIIFHNLFTFLLPSILAILTDALIQGASSSFKNIMFFLFPVLNGSKTKPYHGYMMHFVLLLVLVIADILIYIKSDYHLE